MSTTLVSSIFVFKAGRLHRRENTNWLDPELTKGALHLIVGEDGLLHFQWHNRVTDTIEDVRVSLVSASLTDILSRT